VGDGIGENEKRPEEQSCRAESKKREGNVIRNGVTILISLSVHHRYSVSAAEKADENVLALIPDSVEHQTPSRHENDLHVTPRFWNPATRLLSNPRLPLIGWSPKLQ
jgi:hypothetical protein